MCLNMGCTVRFLITLLTNLLACIMPLNQVILSYLVKVFLSVRMWFGVLLLLGSSGIELSVSAAEKIAPSVDELIRKAVSRAQKVEARAGQTAYTYTKLTVTEELDGSGRLKERKEKVYQVFFQSGSTHLKLLTVNGRPPGAAEMRKQSENDNNTRQIIGSKSGKAAENRDNFLTPEMVARFNFKLIDEQEINGRTAYRIVFEPKRPALPVHRILDRLLDRMSGTIWIDTEEFEMAQAQVHLSSEIDLLGGVIGSLKKLAYTMTRTRVGEGLWFNTFSSGDFEGRKLLDSMRIKTKSQSTNFRRVG